METKRHGPLKLSLKERKVLYLLRLNARMPKSEIAKRVKCSREVVQHIIKKFNDKRIIQQYVLLADLNKLNYIRYCVFVKLKKESYLERKNILNHLLGTPYIVNYGRFLGGYDFLVYVVGKNNYEVNEGMSIFKREMKGKTVKMEFLQIHSVDYPPYNCLLTQKEIKSLGDLKYLESPASKELYKTSREEEEILNELYKRPLTKLHSLSKKVKLPYLRTKKIFEKLRKEGVIIRFLVSAGIGTLNYNEYNIFEPLLSFKEDETKTKASFEQYLAEKCPTIVHITKFMSGKYDYKLNILAKNGNELRTILQNMSKKFPENLEINEILTYGISEEERGSYFLNRNKKGFF